MGRGRGGGVEGRRRGRQILKGKGRQTDIISRDSKRDREEGGGGRNRETGRCKESVLHAVQYSLIATSYFHLRWFSSDFHLRLLP